MVSGLPGAADLELLRALYAHRPGAWEKFARRHQNDIYRPCRLIFPDQDADAIFVQAMDQLRANDFALLRGFDGRAPLSAYLRVVMRDLLSTQVARLLADQPDRGWKAFEYFFKRDIERRIVKQFPDAIESGRQEDLYHEIVWALIENDYRRLKGYKGQGSFGGFVRSTVKNLCIDLLRKEIPRRRLPAAVKRLSGLEQEVFRQLYWERCAPEQLMAALRGKGITVDSLEAAAAVKSVRAALPGDFAVKAGDGERPQMVPLPDHEPDIGTDLADEGLTPEEAVIARQNEIAWQQACLALKTAIAKQPPETRLYLEYVMSKDPPPPPRDIAQLMGRPVTEIYALRQQTERILRQALRDAIPR
jgi:RNA polymerase primary sigma factor